MKFFLYYLTLTLLFVTTAKATECSQCYEELLISGCERLQEQDFDKAIGNFQGALSKCESVLTEKDKKVFAALIEAANSLKAQIPIDGATDKKSSLWSQGDRIFRIILPIVLIFIIYSWVGEPKRAWAVLLTLFVAAAGCYYLFDLSFGGYLSFMSIGFLGLLFINFVANND